MCVYVKRLCVCVGGGGGECVCVCLDARAMTQTVIGSAFVSFISISSIARVLLDCEITNLQPLHSQYDVGSLASEV